MSYYLGGHTFGAGGIDMAVRRAGSAGMDTLQIFTSAPRFYGDTTLCEPKKVRDFERALEETGIARERILVHAAYVLNTASPEAEKQVRARSGLAQEYLRSSGLGLYGVCFHPGSATDGDRTAAAARVGEVITHALRTTPGATRLLIENTAGAGNTFGRTAEEIALALSHVEPDVRHRAGYGLDTCHLFAAGYDISRSAEALGEVLDLFEQTIGERPAFFHLNDSQGAMGSNRDRHALLGEGKIGLDPFAWLLHDPRAQDVPLILETPPEQESVRPDDASADPAEVRMMALLRSLLPSGA